MNLYLVSRTDRIDYDEYDSMVVAAETEQQARETSPDDYHKYHDGAWYQQYSNKSESPVEYHSAWPQSISQLQVQLIGTATPDVKAGVICASFNAG